MRFFNKTTIATWLLILTSAFVWAQKGNKSEILVFMNLNEVVDDRVQVIVEPGTIKAKEIFYFLPKIVPGTYSIDNYGQFIDNFKAVDKKGNALPVVKMDDNTWKISNANKLHRVIYFVNDTFDIEDQHDIFSPSGTNILENENFLINPHGFVGYFKGMDQHPYRLKIEKPKHLFGATALKDLDVRDTHDEFTTDRYATLVDQPIMYSKPDYIEFKVDDMTILLAIYAPSGKPKANAMREDFERMMRAQKRFLGPVNDTKIYAILLYLSDVEKADAGGFGALEHMTSTVVVMPEAMPADQLMQSLIDVVSHEFFHILTPLSVHSEEIHYFDFNNPKMSEHLWLYEGVTEYFANLFQVQQGLIEEDDFYSRMAQKIMSSRRYDDQLPFTKMSASVLSKPYKDNYLNVYEKGALIGMCLDIELRRVSQGKKGLIDLMQALSNKYGIHKPFKDSELFDVITQLTHPDIRVFLDTHVAGTEPIDYEHFLAKVGVGFVEMEVPGNIFLEGNAPLISVNPNTKEIFWLNNATLPSFYESIGIKGGDILLELDGVAYNLDNVYDMLMGSMAWQEGQDLSFKIKRGEEIKTLKGKLILPKQKVEGLQQIPGTSDALRSAWLGN